VKQLHLCLSAFLMLPHAVRAEVSGDQGYWPRNPQAGWDFRFKGFVIGAWWGPEGVDSEMEAYKDAGFNVAMLGRYMTTPDAHYTEEYGTAALLQRQLDLCGKHGVWAMIDSYTPNDKPWGGKMGEIGDHPTHHACSMEELKWLCGQFADHPSLLGFLLSDDMPELDERQMEATRYLHENHPDLMPWVCHNWLKYHELSRDGHAGNPILNLQIYPILQRRHEKDRPPEGNVLAYCSDYANMRKVCQKQNLLMWPMWEALGNTSDSLIRFPIYASLAYGAQGYWAFTYDNNTFVKQGTHRTEEEIKKAKTKIYSVVKKANHRVLAWSSLYLGAESTQILSNFGAQDSVTPGDGQLVVGTSKNVLVGILKKRGAPTMAVIVDARASHEFRGLPRREVRVGFDDSVGAMDVLSDIEGRGDRTVNGNSLTVELDAGQGQLVLLHVRK